MQLIASTRTVLVSRQAKRGPRSVSSMVMANRSQHAPHFELHPSRGTCDVHDVRFAAEACAGLAGDDLAACWASFGCDVAATTAHYAAVAGIHKPEAVHAARPRPLAAHAPHFELSPPRGDCGTQDVRAAREACDGLTGESLASCWAQFGCDITKTTSHYAAVAGLGKPEAVGQRAPAAKQANHAARGLSIPEM